MHPLLIITIVVLSLLYALAWHNQPARNDRRTNESLSKAQPSHRHSKQDYELSR
jgi:hypothetical protein